MGIFSSHKTRMVSAEKTLPGRAEAMEVTSSHLVLGTKITPPFPDGLECAIFGMGCFWGAERTFWSLPGVYTTAVGYSGGLTPNPTYHEVCRGRTGHAEVVLVVFDPAVLSYEQLLRTFFEGHDPTQGMRQGNDVGTQYRSVVYTTTPEQADLAKQVAERFQQSWTRRGTGRSRPRSPRPATSTTPSPITSSIWRRTPVGTAAWAGPGSHALSA